MTRTKNDCPTPKTRASKDIILFPAALYTPAMAAPSNGGKQKKPSFHMRLQKIPDILWPIYALRSSL